MVHKHQAVRQNLASRIRAGEFGAGQRMPADRDLAAAFGVSYMTMRRAVSELVETELLERRIGDGTYVRASNRHKLTSKVLNLICSSYEGTNTKAFLQAASQAADELGWRPHVVRVHPHHERAAVRAIANREEGALVLADESFLHGPIENAVQQAGGRAVLLGNRAQDGNACVLADDARAVWLALEHLQKFGHRDIALVGNHPQNDNERVQLAAWRGRMKIRFDERALERRWIIAGTPSLHNAAPYAYEAVMRYLCGNDETSALLCLSDELALGALAACRDAGRPAPDAMSLVNIGNSPFMEFAYPPITCVDVDMKGHVALALKLVEKALSGKAPAHFKPRLVAPHLVERRSVAERGANNAPKLEPHPSLLPSLEPA